MRIRFSKMHGLGNDFAVVNAVDRPVRLAPGQVRRLADRRRGIGFDQLLLVEPPAGPGVDFNYRVFNVDGGEAEHCGNGARCVAAFARREGLSDLDPLTVATVNRTLRLTAAPGGGITVDMGAPELEPGRVPFAADGAAAVHRRTLELAGARTEVAFTALSMGNPHAVIVAEDLDGAAVKETGEALGRHPHFPDGVNVGFMQVVDRRAIRLRVHERAAGETPACGTGACAAVVAGRLRGLLDESVEVRLAGGRLGVSWRGGDAPVMMTGPAAHVYEGTVEL